MKKQLLTLGLSVALSTFALVTDAKAASFTNGSFESSVYTKSFSFIDLSASNASKNDITGWVVSGETIDYINELWESSEGMYSIDLSGERAGAISQTFDTEAGKSYKVVFDLAGNPVASPSVKKMLVTAGISSKEYTFDVTGVSFSDMGWTEEEFIFNAVENSTTLTFASLTNTCYGAAIDNVRVEMLPTPAPEPSSMILGLMSLGGVFARRRKKVC